MFSLKWNSGNIKYGLKAIFTLNNSEAPVDELSWLGCWKSCKIPIADCVMIEGWNIQTTWNRTVVLIVFILYCHILKIPFVAKGIKLASNECNRPNHEKQPKVLQKGNFSSHFLVINDACSFISYKLFPLHQGIYFHLEIK